MSGRGSSPDDYRWFSGEGLQKLHIASRHVLYLLEEGYGLKQTTTFVGNHFLLSERQRLALCRSLATEEQTKGRKQREMNDISGRVLSIDGFNTIITLEIAFCHSLLLSCMDGTIRDLAGLRGTYRLIPETREAVKILLDTASEGGAAGLHIYLDSPISNSGRLKSLILEEAEKDQSLPVEVEVIREVDKTLIEESCVVSSDSVILDHCGDWYNMNTRCIAKIGAETVQIWR